MVKVRSAAPVSAESAQAPKDASGEEVSPSYSRLLTRALDEVAVDSFQRDWNKHQNDIAARLTSKAVMHELRTGGFLESLIGRLTNSINEISKGEWKKSQRPGLAHLAPIAREWLDGLSPLDRELCCNSAGFIPTPGNLLDLGTNVENNISLFLSHTATAAGLIDAKAVEAKWGAFGKELVQVATKGLTSRSPAELHWSNFGSRASFTPVDRPISFSEFETLKSTAPALAKALLEAAPIPKALPTLNAVVDANDVSFADCEIVMGQHFLGSLCPLVKAILQKGAKPENVALFGVPYSSSPLVMEAVRQMGVRVENSQGVGGAPDDIERKMEIDAFTALNATVERALQSGRKLLMVDDGGIMIRLLSGKAEFVSHDEKFKERYLHFLSKTKNMAIRAVEQTTRGITEFESAKGSLPPNVTLVNMARSEAKAHADRYIGPSVVQGLERGLRNLGNGTLHGKKVCLIGYGVIGRWIAEELRRKGAIVTVTDIDHESLDDAKARGFRVEAKPRVALNGQDVVLGCTGRTSVTYEDYLACSWGTVFASATSKAVEFFTKHIQEYMRTWAIAPGSHGQNVVVTVGDKSQHHRSHQVIQWDSEDTFSQVGYYLLNDGSPINFDGEVNCVAPEHIQVTEAIKFEALAQALTSKPGLGLVDLEPQRQERALIAQDTFVPGWRS